MHNVNQLSLDRLEGYSKNIFSNIKEDRQKARASIVRHVGQFQEDRELTKKEKEKYPQYHFVSDAINKFVEENEFVFKINDKKPGYILAKGKKSFPGKHSSLPKNSNEPTYLVTMPHLAGGKHSLEKQIRLLFNESFGLNRLVSAEETKTRLHLFVGINYCHSIDHKVNKQKKKCIADLVAEPLKPNVSYETFCWAPNWEYSNSIHTGNASKNRVKRLFRLLQEISEKKASKIYSDVMESKVIPFQSIREEIRDSDSLASHFEEFRSRRKDRPCYLGVVDDDAVRLRTNGVGLFSHYDELIELHPKLEAATTGYYMADPNNAFIKIVSGTNLVGRRAIAISRPNGTYLPEPNVIFKLPEGNEISLDISFLRAGSNRGGNLESLGMLENLGLMKGDVKGRVVFGDKGAIQTGVSPNVKIPTHLARNVDSESFLIPKNLASLRGFSQSSINPRSFAENILRTFPQGSNTKKIGAVVGNILKSFDPIEYAKNIPDCWLITYDSILNAVVDIYNSDDIDDLNLLCRKSASTVIKESKIDSDQKKPITQLIEEKANSLFEAKKFLLNVTKSVKKKKIHLFNKRDVGLFVQTSINVGQAVFEHLQSVINDADYTL